MISKREHSEGNDFLKETCHAAVYRACVQGVSMMIEPATRSAVQRDLVAWFPIDVTVSIQNESIIRAHDVAKAMSSYGVQVKIEYRDTESNAKKSFVNVNGVNVSTGTETTTTATTTTTDATSNTTTDTTEDDKEVSLIAGTTIPAIEDDIIPTGAVMLHVSVIGGLRNPKTLKTAYYNFRMTSCICGKIPLEWKIDNMT